jgi:PAP2 superfamily C-terminal
MVKCVSTVYFKLSCGLLFFLIALYLNGLGHVYIEHYLWKWTGSRDAKDHGTIQYKLWDFGFMLLGDAPWTHIEWLPDFSNATMMIMSMVPIVVLHPRSSLVGRRIFATLGVVYFFRSVCLVVTLLPNPSKTCDSNYSHMLREHESIPWEALKVVFRQRVTCGDVMFSGHATLLTQGALVIHEYVGGIITNYALQIVVRILYWLFACFGYVVIVGTHFHYTIDVVLAVVLTVYSFKMYHYLVKANRFSMITWYESDEDDYDVAAVDADENKPLV